MGKGKRPPASRSPSSSAVDLEEIAPNRFLIRNKEAARFLKGEGDLQGVMFVLKTWRRDGLLARLRQGGMVVRTLEEQVRKLPKLPPAVPLGDPRPHPLRPRERLSGFDPVSLTWTPLEATTDADDQGEGEEHAQQPALPLVRLRVGQVVRQRDGRGGPRFARVVGQGSGVRLVPLSETDALLAGYAQAQAAHVRRPPLRVRLEGATCYLPALELPAPHRDVLRHLGEPAPQGWKIDRKSYPLAREVYHLLGVSLRLPNQRKQKH